MLKKHKSSQSLLFLIRFKKKLFLPQPFYFFISHRETNFLDSFIARRYRRKAVYFFEINHPEPNNTKPDKSTSLKQAIEVNSNHKRTILYAREIRMEIMQSIAKEGRKF
jgi:hypothetical protein